MGSMCPVFQDPLNDFLKSIQQGLEIGWFPRKTFLIIAMFGCGHYSHRFLWFINFLGIYELSGFRYCLCKVIITGMQS